MGTRWTIGWVCLAVVAAVGCDTEPAVVASNCDTPGDCVTPAALRIDAVDILLVLDNSGSIQDNALRLQAELPRMLEAITTGRDEDTRFPPASSVHVGVTTTYMDIAAQNVPGCMAPAQDGVFVKPGEVGLSCEVSYPGYLAYEGAAAPVSTVSSVGCLPLVLPDANNSSPWGCGWEQPLEAALKSLWPGAAPGVTFLSGTGHGLDANAGFLRANSLLIVIVVSDEDDCSAEDLSIFSNEDSAVNLRCVDGKDKLYDVERYVSGFSALRPNNDNLIFGVIAGIPTDWVSEAVRNEYDLSTSAGVRDYYDDILASEPMQEVAMDGSAGKESAYLRPSCNETSTGHELRTPDAFPPRRLLEVAKGFGARSVIGSICSSDYGTTTGQIIRAIGERLTDAAKH